MSKDVSPRMLQLLRGFLWRMDHLGQGLSAPTLQGMPALTCEIGNKLFGRELV